MEGTLSMEYYLPCNHENHTTTAHHFSATIMSVSQITSISIAYSTICSSVDQGKYQSSVSLAFVRGIHRWLVNSLHKGPVRREKFSFDDVTMNILTDNSSQPSMCGKTATYSLTLRLKPRQNGHQFADCCILIQISLKKCSKASSSQKANIVSDNGMAPSRWVNGLAPDCSNSIALEHWSYCNLVLSHWFILTEDIKKKFTCS